MAKRLAKWCAYTLLILLLLAALAITFTIGWRPVIGPRARSVTARRFESTPARLERGQYLANGVTGCLGCHTELTADGKNAAKPASKPGAGRIFVDQPGFRVVAPNITPDRETGVGAWTDDELARAIREGVSRDGHALFPIMPYQRFHIMSDEDLASIIVYLRTLEPARTNLPRTAIPFALSRIINNVPQPLDGPVPAPDTSTAVKRGEYMVTLSACADCHTPTERGQPIAGMEFAGGTSFTDVGQTAAAANITPDASGIAYYDEALFLSAIRTGHVKARALSPAMPWWFYRNQSDDDLKSMFAYLRTLKPVQHRVDNGEPPTLCRLCRQKHGLGDRN